MNSYIYIKYKITHFKYSILSNITTINNYFTANSIIFNTIITEIIFHHLSFRSKTPYPIIINVQSINFSTHVNISVLYLAIFYF